MKFFRNGLVVVSCLVAGSSAFAAGMHHRSSKKTHSTFRDAAGMSTSRATEIQSALIKAHYMDGEPTGVWDQQSKDAMTKFQGDNGWQTKMTPDSRALIKLGLGPDQTGAAPVVAGSSIQAPAASGAGARGTLGSAIASQQELVLSTGQ